jgi:tetratricopeptide (TPR) repeat protein
VFLSTLGKLKLASSDFKETLPLLLLAYLALHGKTHRAALADLVWARKPASPDRHDGLNETLYRLRKLSKEVSGELIISEGKWLTTTVKTDVQALQEALRANPAQETLELYTGHFLAGLEHNDRLPVGADFTEWLINTREKIYTDVFSLGLDLAHNAAFAGDFAKAANLAWQSYVSSTGITYPDPETFLDLHTLLVAAERFDDAKRLKAEAEDAYGEEAFAWVTPAFEASENALFVNREKELATVLGYLESSQRRWLTITGEGGLGKSELASVVARKARGQAFCKDGVHVAWLEYLPPDCAATRFLDVLSGALGLEPVREVSDLVSAIGDDHKLFILDNFEQLLPHRHLVAELYEACKNLRLLVTSRARLGFLGEAILPLSPLHYPSGDIAFQAAHDYGAVKLFDLRSQSYGFTLTEQNLPDVLKICRLTDGLPLALNLAAAWTGTLNVKTIAENISRELGFLGGEGLRATFDASLELLTPKDKLSFIKLGVFADSFTLAAAQKVTTCDLVSLRSLIDKSLLRYNQESERYSFHPLLHQYANDLLKANESLYKTLKETHAAYFLDDLLLVTNSATNEDKAAATKRTSENLKDVADAWHYAVASGWPQQLFQACKPLQHFGDSTARYAYAAELLELARKHSYAHEAAYVALTSNLGYLRYRLGKYQEAIDLAGESLSKLDALEIPKERKLSLLELNYVTQYSSYSSLGEFDKTLAMAKELHSVLSREAPESIVYATSLVNLTLFEGEIAGIFNIESFQRAVHIFENNKEQKYLPFALVNMIDQLISMGRFLEVEQTLQKSRDWAITFQSQHWLMMCQYYQAILYLHQEDYELAEELCKDLLEQAENAQKASISVIVYRLLAKLELKKFGDYQLARNYLETALQHAKAIEDIAFANGVLIDQLSWYITQQQYTEAKSLREVIKQELPRTYFQDKETFQNLLKENMWLED